MLVFHVCQIVNSVNIVPDEGLWEVNALESLLLDCLNWSIVLYSAWLVSSIPRKGES